MGCGASSQTPTDAAPTAASTRRRTPKLAIIVHRHGARFPTKPFPGDLSWPAAGQFWDKYEAQLTPTGSLQHVELGRKVRKRYDALFADLDPKQINDVVRSYTSNKQRTLFSAWSFLNGMFPSTPRHFMYLGDRQHLDMAAVEAELEKTHNGMGIAIMVEPTEDTDELFHQIKSPNCDEKAQKFKKKEMLKHPRLTEMAQDAEFLALADKLYRMTEIPKLAPDQEAPKRLQKFKSVFTQIEVANTHGLPLLPNQHGDTLSEQELAHVYEAARIKLKYMYRPVESELVADGIGKDGAGYLGSEIGKLLADKMHGNSKLRFVEFSAHDSTILALASLLGVDIVNIGFCGNFLFELYEENGGWTVEVIWNPNPTEMTEGDFDKIQPIGLPLDGKYADFNNLPTGPTCARKMVNYLTMRGLKMSEVAFKKMSEFVDTIKDGTAPALDQVKAPSMTPEKEKDLKEAFTFYDSNHDGTISATELTNAFRKMGLTTVNDEDVKALLTVFEKDADAKLTFTEFCFMINLVSSI